jgi:hypothetical protein
MTDPGSIGGGGIGRALGGAAGNAIVRRRAEKYVAEGKAEVALRVVEGAQEGLKSGWRRGVATLWAGRLDFESAVGGFQPWRRAPVAVTVSAIDASAPRKPAGKDVISLDAECLIVPVLTPTARLDLAVAPAYRLEWVLQRLWPRG